MFQATIRRLLNFLGLRPRMDYATSMEIAEDFMKRYRNALRELAK